jgi:isoleucyl-tRNA synthetase
MAASYYPEVDPNPNFPAIEEAVQIFWKQEKIFEASVEQHPASAGNEFVFYDGPPFANGLPHYGHIVTGYVKDVVPRYRTMRGYRVERRFGWDCHGLPAEVQAEQELGVSGRKQILDYGMAKFNAHCRSSVLQFTKDWETYVTRQARWVDFKNDYKTMDLSFMESVIWAFKELWKKGWIYEDYRVVPYSWAVESPLSNFETRLDDSYRERQDPAITVMFELTPQPDDPMPMRLLAWTTTPWTLPSNLALAVGPDIDYALFEENGTLYVLAETTVEKYDKQLAEAQRYGTIKGRELVERHYQPLFPFFAQTPNAFRVLPGDFVNTEEGTGVVHMAPGFGEDDLNTCRAHDIPVVMPVDPTGRFTSEVPPYEGQLVFDANRQIIRDLRDRGVLIKHETYVHNYPHCWRTDEPLIYKAINSWYVKVTAFRDRMVELNQGINWVPQHIRDGRFGRWLEEARDWNISRNRFWGSPLPVWKSDDPNYPRLDVYGSLDEIEQDFGVRLTDLHRPGIDALVRPNPDDPTGNSMMRRVEEVLDCWFESGSMPFAQVHYPFDNKDWFEQHFPGDFIVEYIAQTRGWFYTMMVMSTALFDRAPFKNCICHGVVLDEKHQKLSKRLQNYTDPLEVFDTFGADALRWYLVASPILAGGDLAVPKDGRPIREALRLVIRPIWNAYSFFCLYANADAIQAEVRNDAHTVLDRYILAKTRTLVEEVTDRMEVYDLPGACAVVSRYIDALNNWYIRRSRARFWKAERDQDKVEAYDTLYTALTVLCRVVSPFLPMIAEDMYKGLTQERSVHLAAWPEPDALPADAALVEDMDRVRDICSAVLSIRESQNLRVRLPLASLTIAGTATERLQPYLHLIQDEVNVKTMHLTDSAEAFGTFELQVNKRIGARIGSAMQQVLAAAHRGEWRRLEEGQVEVGGEILGPEDYSLRLRTPEGIASQALSGSDGVVVLDVNVTPELEQEGLARDLVRLVQMTRKEAALHIADRIELALAVPDEVREAVEAHRDFVCNETLAVAVRFTTDGTDEYQAQHTLQGQELTIGVRRMSHA